MLSLVVSWAVKCSRGNGTHSPFRTERTTVLISAFFSLSFLVENSENFIRVEVWGTKHEVMKGWLLVVLKPVLHANLPLSSSECFVLDCGVFKGNIWESQPGALPFGPASAV